MIPTDCQSETHEQVLAQVLVGDLERGAPAVRQVIATCPSCRTSLTQLITLAELMELEGEAGEDLLASLDYAREAPGSNLVAPFFEQRVRELPEPRPGPQSNYRTPSFWRPWRVAAAAAVVATGLGLWLFSQPTGVEASPQERILLGSSSFQFQGAVGPVAEYGTITWGADGLSSADRYEITILDADSNIVLEPFTVEHPAWTPTDAQLRALPDAIQGVVVALGVSGQSVGAPGLFSASR